MQIKQLTNGKIQFWKAGKIVFSCLPSQNYIVRSDDEIQLVSTGQKAYSIFAAEILFVSIFGGALTPTAFNDSQELAEYLDANFFFEPLVVSSIFSVFGETGDYNQSQSSIKSFGTSTALVNGTTYAVPIYLGGVYTEFAMIKLGAAAGDFNYGIYGADPTGGNPHTPLNLLHQSPEYTFITGGASAIDTLAAPLYFAPGLYFFAFQGNSNLAFRGAITSLTFNGFSLTGTPDMSTISRYTVATAYATTLPAVFPAFVKDLTNVNIPLLYQKKQL